MMSNEHILSSDDEDDAETSTPAQQVDLTRFVTDVLGATTGWQFRSICELLPSTNAKTGRSLVYIRVAKVMKQHGLLSEDANFKFSCLNKKTKAVFFNSLDLCHSNPSVFRKIKRAALFGFPKLMVEVIAAPESLDLKLVCNSSAESLNRIALLAHLLVEPNAREILRKIYGTIENEHGEQVPTIEDQTEVKKLYANLLKLAEEIKPSCRNLYEPPYITDEVFTAISAIDPTKASFKSIDDLKKCLERATSIHDTLLSHLDRHLENLPPTASSDRRRRCYDTFFSVKGRSKNVGLYYCFLTWEKTCLGFLSSSATSRRKKSGFAVDDREGITLQSLLSWTGASSSAASSSEFLPSSSSSIFAYRDAAQQRSKRARTASYTPSVAVSTAATKAGGAASVSGNRSGNSGTRACNELVPAADLPPGSQPPVVAPASMARFYIEKSKTEETQRLLRVMESPVFAQLAQGEQERITAELLKVLGV